MEKKKKILMSDKSKGQSTRTVYRSPGSAAQTAPVKKEPERKSPDYALRRTVAGLLVILVAVMAFFGVFELFFRMRADDRGLIISEVMSNNVSALCDENGDFRDIIEITNTSDKTVYLKGIGLTDKEGRARFRFEDGSIEPHGACVVFCAGTFPFSLRKDGGETLRMLDGLGREICSLVTVPMKGNQSIIWDGEQYVLTDEISPGFPNGEEGVAAYNASRNLPESPIVINEAVTSNVTFTADRSQMVEIMNRSSEAVELSDYYLSDNGVERFRFRLPSGNLESGEIRVFTFGTEGADADFRFSNDEYIILSDAQGRTVSEVPAKCFDDWSISFLDDESYSISSEVSIGYPNDEAGVKAFASAHGTSGLIINEVMTNNRSYAMLWNGDRTDPVELYNGTDHEIDLSEYWLSDDSGDLQKAQLSGTIAPGGYRTFLASREEARVPDGYTVISLGLSKNGDSLILSKGNEPLQCVYIPALEGDTSYGKASSGEYAVLSSVTLGEANSSARHKCEAPVLSMDGGVYNGVESLRLEISGEGTVRYTTDGRVPTEDSAVCSGVIELTATSVIRARCFRDGYSASDTVTATYVINENHTLDVACLVSDPDGLFDYYSGIYATGPGADPVSPHYGANYWKGWEREARVTLYTEDGGFDLPCGLRVFGGYSKAFGQKSLAVIFRGKYGASRLDYRLFGDEGLDSYETFIFRSTGQDVYQAHMRDALTTSIFEDKVGEAFVQKCRPVVLYINAEYWGVYFIREKVNEHYVAGRCNVDEDTVTILFQTGWASSSYQNLVSWAENHDLSVQENFDYVAERINIDSYVNYLIAEIYSGNFDIGNVRYFSSPDYDNGRWTWIFYDVDWSMYFLHRDSASELFGSSIVYSSRLIWALFKNKEFKDHFFTEFARQLNEVWNEEVICSYVDEFYAALQPEMARECSRWEWSYSTWEEEVEWIRTFSRERPAEVYKFLKNYFNFSDAQMEAYGFRND